MAVKTHEELRNNHEKYYTAKMTPQDVRDFLKGKYEVIPKKEEHIKVDADKCNGCEACADICPAGCYDMVDGKAKMTHLELCVECGTCNYVCEWNAIDWSYPEGGTGVILKWS